MTTTGNTEFHSCDSQLSTMTSDRTNQWKEEGVPRVIHIRPRNEDTGGLLSDERVDSDELDNLDIISILTDDETVIEPKDSKQQGVGRVIEALRSFQVRRLAEKEAQQQDKGVPATPKSVKQQRFFASRQENSTIPQTTTPMREKGRIQTPDTMNSSPDKSLSKDDEKGIASLRRFLTFGKGKAPSPAEPGLASMGEEDTVQ
jgi:hypothetical protein